MPISGNGWEIHFVRTDVHRRNFGKHRVRTVGYYQIYHDGVAQNGTDMSGMFAEPKGPGANYPENNGRRIEAGTYGLRTQGGGKYKTYHYNPSVATNKKPKPGVQLLDTGDRTEILIHPGANSFLSSSGCINLCTNLPNETELITYISSRRRVISMIDDMSSFLGSDFPDANERNIFNAHAVIDGEP